MRVFQCDSEKCSNPATVEVTRSWFVVELEKGEGGRRTAGDNDVRHACTSHLGEFASPILASRFEETKRAAPVESGAKKKKKKKG